MKKLLPLLFLLPRLAIAGDSVGNGADYFSDEDGAAWFGNSKKSVTYCLEISPKFGLDQAAVVKEIDSAVYTWRKYVEKKKIHPNISFDFRRNEVCSGTEDLTFFFGVINERVKNAQSGHASPVGLAVQESFNRETGWGKGFLWVTDPGKFTGPNGEDNVHWPDKGRLGVVLLHEFGHIFGCSHTPGTVMAPAILTDFLSWRDTNAIDISRELVLGRDKMEYDDGGVADGRAVFLLLTGKTLPPETYVYGRVERDALGDDDVVKGKLFLQPSFGEELSFPFESKKRIATLPDSASYAFRTAQPLWFSPVDGTVFYGSIQSLNGEKKDVSISLNLGGFNGPFEIRSLQNSLGADVLFRAGLIH